MVAGAKAVVMAGGRGERFWPVSTLERPKQFIDLTGGGTLIQQTVMRLAQILPYRDIFVVTSAAHVELARTQLPQVPARNFIVEPVGRDTAPCIGLAAVWLERLDPGATMLVVPADAFIPDWDVFCDTAQAALDFAAQSKGIVTIGIQPTRPETGYGYIEVGDRCPEAVAKPVHRAQRFVEKPDHDRAQEYLDSGRFLWNAGMFAMPVRTIRGEIAKYLPELHEGLERMAASPTTDAFYATLPVIFPSLPKMSIDFGVMERTDKVYVVPGEFTWDDLGSWSAVARYRVPDQDGNTVNGRVLAEDCHNVLVESKGRLVATLGVSDLIIVETEEAVLVCAKDRAQDIRRLALKAQEGHKAVQTLDRPATLGPTGTI